MTRLADRPDPVPDKVWDEAARHYDGDQLAALVLSIGAINAWNRIDVATRRITGEWIEHYISREPLSRWQGGVIRSSRTAPRGGGHDPVRRPPPPRIQVPRTTVRY